MKGREGFRPPGEGPAVRWVANKPKAMGETAGAWGDAHYNITGHTI
jgi:hypothetical protein